MAKPLHWLMVGIEVHKPAKEDNGSGQLACSTRQPSIAWRAPHIKPGAFQLGSSSAYMAMMNRCKDMVWVCRRPKVGAMMDKI